MGMNYIKLEKQEDLTPLGGLRNTPRDSPNYIW